MLENLPHNEAISKAVKTLIQCAIENATSLNDLGFDHAGPLYHKVLGNAQSDGAYYTKNISAYILAGLAINDEFIDWSDQDAVSNLKIVDPACGTGTLLMAALHVIKKLATEAQQLDEDEKNRLHKGLVENAIFGFDINKYSVQLAACNLTIGAPNTDYERINLHTLQHGPIAGCEGDKPEDVRHGTLERLLGDSLGEIIDVSTPLLGQSVTRTKLATVDLPSKFDVVIYNPPFTETQNQNKKYKEKVKSAMADRLHLIKSSLKNRNTAAADAIAKRSIRPFFTPLATSLVPDRTGKLAKIGPSTMCISENGRAERKFLASNFHIDMIVTSHDPNNGNFSENTNIHESLVIGNRKHESDKPTRFIQLAKYPGNVKEADELIAAISHNKGGGGIPRHYGQQTKCAMATGLRFSGLTQI